MLFTPSFIAAESAETLAIRRIATCYYEKDFALSIELIDDFFRQFPNTTHAENVYSLLADTYLQQREWEKALTTYQLLQDPDLSKDCITQKLYCLYSLQRFTDLKAIAATLLEEINNFSKADQELIYFYYAEALLKENKEQTESNILNQAEQIYLDLLNSSYASYAKISLAYLYSLKGNHEKAAEFFTESADLFLEWKEKLLFAAANQQCFFDFPLATKTFEYVKGLHASNQKEALYNWMLLLFHSENFAKIIETKEDLLSQTPAARKANTYFLIGKAFYKEKNYLMALEHLDQSLLCQTNLNELKETLFIGLLSSYHLKDFQKLEHYLSSLEKKFKNTVEYAEALFWKGKLLQEQKEWAKAIVHFQKALKLNFEKTNASSLYQLGVTYFLQNNFQKSYEFFWQVIDKYPHSNYHSSAVSHLVHAAINAYNKKESSKVKEQLLQAHLIALDTKDFFQEEQLPQVYLSLAKLYLDLNQAPNCCSYLDRFINAYAMHPLAYQAHLLYAFYYKVKQKDFLAYLQHLENAALTNPPHEIASVVNADLFYGYLKQIKQKQSFDTLYENICDATIRLIQLNYSFPKNIYLWFCQSIFQHIEKLENKSQKSLEKLEMILKHFQSHFTPLETLAEENMILNIAHVLGWQNKHQEQLLVLQNILDHFSKNHPLYVKALYQKALCLEASGQKKLAIENYEQILAHPGLAILEISLNAKNHLARLLMNQYFVAPSMELSEKIKVLYQSLNVSRSLQNEPLHLEAALDFSLFNHLKEVSEGHYEPLLNSLIKIKLDFSATDTVLTREYHESRTKDQSKNNIFEQYMQYIDAKIAHLQAKIHFQKKDFAKYTEKKAESQKLLTYLMKTSLTPYLKYVCEIEQACVSGHLLIDQNCVNSLIREEKDEL